MIEAFEGSPLLKSLGLITIIPIVFSAFIIPAIVIISTFIFFKKIDSKKISIFIPSL